MKKEVIKVKSGDVYYSKEFDEYYLISSGLIGSDISDFVVTKVSNNELISGLNSDTGILSNATKNKNWSLICNIPEVLGKINQK